MHQLSRGSSQNPFRRNRGRVVRVAFHPGKPVFFVATENAVRVYDLALQQLVKKLVAGSGSISSVAIHPSGDHVITGAEVPFLSLSFGSNLLGCVPTGLVLAVAEGPLGVTFRGDLWERPLGETSDL